MGFMERDLNSVEVTSEDIAKAAAAFFAARRSADYRATMLAVAGAFTDPELSLVAPARFAAMLQLIQSGALPGWCRINLASGAATVDVAVFRAAAEAPLILNEASTFCFDPNRFRDSVLRLAGVSGHA